MANNVSYVTAGKPARSGAIYVAPVGTTLPTDAETALGQAFLGLGYVSEEGLSNNNAPETDSVKAWGGDTVLFTQTDKEDTFGFKLIEIMNVNVLKLVYGDDNVSGDLTNGITVTANTDDPEEHALVIDMILKGDVLKRIVIPRGKVTDLGEINYIDDDAVGYDVTVSCVPDSSGNTHYEYIKG